jgi:Rieske Fe-S protein
MKKPQPPIPDTSCCVARRRWLQRTLGAVVVGASGAAEAIAASPAKLPPQIGDLLSFPSWEQDGRLVTPADLAPNAAPRVVYPRDPTSEVVREKSRLNQILLLKLEPAAMDKATRRLAVDGVVAYSGVCSHAACAVSDWKAAQRRLVCPCHGSEYDATRHASVVAGPAPRALPALPLALAGQHFVVSGKFTGKVGLKKL